MDENAGSWHIDNLRKGERPYEVLGIQFVDYVSRKTGNPVKGVTLHSCYPDGQVKGEAVDSIFVSDNLGLDFLYQILPGDEVNIEYNNRGYVCNVAPLS